MVGLVLVTHGNLAEEFLHAVEHVVGPQDHFATICIGPDDDMERRRQDILQAVKQVSISRGVIILTDMFGGTPSNMAISVMEEGAIEVIAGVNLPLLIKLVSLRQCPEFSMAEILSAAQEAGRKYITIPSMILADRA
ncbi:PTS sugar transporter subunit IIA [Bartonella sp. DGB2]|uniref:PTS sugar transporter subunit IIA n=1 Tax=Bartonella sp. DGB2 TaxID=3388426 RepID=UPI00398FE55D